jgi:methionyl-tRNA formyltransferase
VNKTAVVFAYHNVGVRGLLTLLAHRIHIPLIISHTDDPRENIWFDSVTDIAARYDIPVITPDNPNAPEIIEKIRAISPDFIFSFYYRHMLTPGILGLAKQGAYNMHGSLLPKYRGRVPINWAVLNGETETGATLHEMVAKPDAGRIVSQERVPILPDETAHDVFQKVVVAAEAALNKALPGLIAGTAPHIPQDLTQGSYYGGRKPEDGRINWQASGEQIHNLVRAVAPPYPGAWCQLGGDTLHIDRTERLPGRTARYPEPTLYRDEEGYLCLDCTDGAVLHVLKMRLNGQIIMPSAWNKVIHLLQN